MLTPEQMQKAFTALGSDLGQKYINDMAKVQMGTPQHQTVRTQYQLLKQTKDAEAAQAKADKDAEAGIVPMPVYAPPADVQKNTGLSALQAKYHYDPFQDKGNRKMIDEALKGGASIDEIAVRGFGSGVPGVYEGSGISFSSDRPGSFPIVPADLGGGVMSDKGGKGFYTADDMRAGTDYTAQLGRAVQTNAKAAKNKDAEFKPYFQYAGTDPGTGERVVFNARTGEFIKEKGGMLDPGKKKPMSGTQQDALANIDTNIAMFEGLLADNPNNIYNTGFTGPVGGRLGGVTAIFSPKEGVFRQQYQKAFSDLIFGEGGKQLTETEKAMVAPSLPQLTDADDVFQAKLKKSVEILKTIRDSKMGVYEKTGTMTSVKNPSAPGGGSSGMSDEELLRALGVQ